MNKQLRKPVIAGNWKMNNTPAEAIPAGCGDDTGHGSRPL